MIEAAVYLLMPFPFKWRNLSSGSPLKCMAFRMQGLGGLQQRNVIEDQAALELLSQQLAEGGEEGGMPAGPFLVQQLLHLQVCGCACICRGGWV